MKTNKMAYRNRKIERKVLDYLKMLPPALLDFPFDIYRAIDLLPNCKVHSYQAFAQKHDTTIDAVISLCQSETGCTHTVNDNHIIMFNDSLHIPQERKLFTLAHEIGHIMSGHFNLMENCTMAQNKLNETYMEREANYFAACLLCPTPVLYKFKFHSISEVQKYFKLSFEAAEIAWKDYEKYDRTYNISWHNDIIRLFLSSNGNRDKPVT